MSHLHAKDAQLFAFLTWKTYDNRPLLGNDELRQAAYLAVTRRTRNQLCRVLAIGGTDRQVGVIVRFPASLPITCLLRIAPEAAQDALERVHKMLGSDLDLPCYWSPECTARTLSATEAADAWAYLRQHLPD